MEPEPVEWIELSTRRQSAIWYAPQMARKRGLTPEALRKAEDLPPFVLTINQLPDLMLLQIFSFLPPSSLGVAVQVSRRWRNLSEDRHLWRDKIRQQFYEKQFVNHKLSPILFQVRHSSINIGDEGEYASSRAPLAALAIPSKTPKQVYVKFFIEESVGRKSKNERERKRIFTLWKSVAQKRPKKIVLYGDGLKNPFSSRLLLQFLLGVSTDDLSTEFKVTGMMTGGCRGVIPILDFLLNGRTGILGAWISLEFKGHDFTLVTICETYNQPNPLTDGLLVRGHASPSAPVPSLSPKFHQLFDDADGFVCVTDAWKILASASPSIRSTTAQNTTAAKTTTTTATSTTTTAPDSFHSSPNSFGSVETDAWEEELSLLSKNCHSSGLRMKAAPLLVLPLMNTDDPRENDAIFPTTKSSIFRLTEILNKRNLVVGRPWQVNALDLRTMQGVTSGFEWILHQRR